MYFFFCVENGVEESAQPTIVRASRDRRRFNQNVCNIFAFICAQTYVYMYIFSSKDNKFYSSQLYNKFIK